MLKKIVLVFAAIALAKAQIPSLGWCPEYIPMANFDLNRFLGVWYEAERYFQLSEVVSRCVTANYTRGADGKVRVSNEVTNRFTGIKRVLDGELKPSASKSEEGKLQVKYTTVPLTPETQYSVLETDYKNYAVLWSCSGIGPVHAQNAWLMTRKRYAPGDVMQLAYGVLDKYKISKRFFVKTDQAECAYEAPEPPAQPEAAAPAPAPVAETKPEVEAAAIKEPVLTEPAPSKKSANEIHLRSAAVLREAEPLDETKKEETPAKPADEPAQELPIANVEPSKDILKEEKPAADEVKPQDFQLKFVAPETIPEVILKVAESAKESAAAPISNEPLRSVIPVAEESKTVEVAVPAESKPEIIGTVPLPETADAKPKTAEVAATTAEEPKVAEATPIEEPKAAEPAVKSVDEPKLVETQSASEEIKETKPVEPLPALRTPLVAEIEKPVEIEKIESPAPAVLVEAVATKSAEGVVPIESVKEVKIAETPAVPAVPVESAPADSALLKTVEVVPKVEDSKPVITESKEPAEKIQEIGEQLLKKEAALPILEPVVLDVPVAPVQPLKSAEVAPQESKVKVVDEAPKTLEPKP